MSTAKSVSIIIPVHNEREVIEGVILDIYNNIIVELEDSELIVAEDGSSDGTREILERLQRKIPIKLVCSDERKGYAKAVRDALSLATKEIVFFTDSDGQHKESDFWKMYAFIEDFDVVSGHKYPRNDTLFRVAISRVMNIFIFIMYSCSFRDINSGFKVIRKTALDKLLPISNELDFISTELMIKAHLMKMKIAEVPIRHYEREFGDSRGLPTAKLPKMIIVLILGLLKIKIRSFSNYYRSK